MSSINRWIATGILVQPPERKRTSGGKELTEILLEVVDLLPRGPGDTSRIESQIPVEFWGRRGEDLLSQRLQQGDLVAVEGRIGARHVQTPKGGSYHRISIFGDSCRPLNDEP